MKNLLKGLRISILIWAVSGVVLLFYPTEDLFINRFGFSATVMSIGMLIGICYTIDQIDDN